MKINFSTKLFELDGKTEIKDQADHSPMTIGRTGAAALNSFAVDGKNGDERVKAGVLAMKIYGAKELELSAGEVTLLRKAVANHPIPTVMVAQIVQVIDPESIEKPK